MREILKDRLLDVKKLDNFNLDAKTHELKNLAESFEEIIINNKELVDLATELLEYIHLYRYQIGFNKATEAISGRYDVILKESWQKLKYQINNIMN